MIELSSTREDLRLAGVARRDHDGDAVLAGVADRVADVGELVMVYGLPLSRSKNSTERLTTCAPWSTA